MTSLQQAVDFLYDKTYIQDKWTSTARLDALAEYCIEEMQGRGISPWEDEVRLDSWARDKQWDVVHPPEGRPKIAISMKSILKNLAGTVPNRTDDLIGEVTDLQMRYPEIVIGYIVLVDAAVTEDEPNRREWANELEARLQSISGRSPPYWGTGSVEAACVIKTDLAGEGGPEILTDESETEEFFDTLTEQYSNRYGGQQTF
jgi:hypothetical protein